MKATACAVAFAAILSPLTALACQQPAAQPTVQQNLFAKQTYGRCVLQAMLNEGSENADDLLSTLTEEAAQAMQDEVPQDYVPLDKKPKTSVAQLAE